MDSPCAVRLLLLLGLALGLATAAATATTVTPRSDDDVLRDLETDGLLVDQHLLTILTTQAPHTQTTPLETTKSPESVTPERTEEDRVVKEESAPVEDEQIPEEREGSALGEEWVVGRVLRHSDSDNSSSTTPAPEVRDRSTAEPREDNPVTSITLGELLPYWREGGSGHGDSLNPVTESTATTTATPVKTTLMFSSEEGSAIGAAADFETTPALRVTEETLTEVENQGESFARNMNTGTPRIGELNAPQVTEMPKGHVTPDWVIIVGFLVGVAALVLLCVAIATRDRWNRHSQFNQTGAGLQPADQQRALEMQTFLHEQQPKENGKAEEYTVIPLDELPETYSS